MMQTLDVISINLWNILISFLNLGVLFLIVKKFLFKPVKKLFAQRQAEIDARYAAADAAEHEAQAHKTDYEQRLKNASERADAILKDAAEQASFRADQIVAEAQHRADGIVARAKEEAELTEKNAEAGMKHEIVEVSTALAEKMLEREVRAEDHRALIDSFISQIGEDDG